MGVGQWLIRSALAITIAVMFVSVGLGVGSRYLVGQPLFWTDELARFALVWMTFIGAAALLTRSDGHIRFDLLEKRFSIRTQAVLSIICNVAIAAVLAIILIGSLLMMRTSLRHFSPALSIPMPLVYAIIPISALIGLYVTARRSIEQVSSLRSKG